MNTKLLLFVAICGEHLIDPNIALENENVKKCVDTNNFTKLRTILEEEF